MYKEPQGDSQTVYKRICSVNQAPERYANPFSNCTDNSILEVTWMIRQMLNIPNAGLTDQEVFSLHTMIVNVNPFPSLGYGNSGKISSYNNRIGRWAKHFMNDIEKEIRTFSPDFIICGNTLSHFIDFNSLNNNEDVSLWGYPYLHVSKDEYALYNNEVIILDAYHPAAPQFNSTNVVNCIDKCIKIRKSQRV